jgi:hypothetical protein
VAVKEKRGIMTGARVILSKIVCLLKNKERDNCRRHEDFLVGFRKRL